MTALGRAAAYARNGWQSFRPVLASAKDTPPLLLSGVGSRLLIAGQAIYLARTLGPGTYGVLAIATAVVGIAFQFIDSRSWECMTRFLPLFIARGENGRARHLLRSLVILDAGAAAFAAAVLIVSASLLGSLLNLSSAAVDALRAYALVLPASFCIPISIATLRLVNKHRWVAIHEIGSAALQVCCVVGAVWVSHSAVSVAWALVLANALQSVSAAALSTLLALPKLGLHRDVATGVTRLGEYRREVLRFLASTNVIALIKGARRNLDTIIVGGLMGPVAAGMYKIGKNFADLFGFATQPLYQIGYSRLATQTHDRIARKTTLRHYLTLAAVVATLGIVANAVLGRYIVHLVLGPAYSEVATLLGILIPATGILMVTQFIHASLLTGGKTARPIISQGIGTGIQLLLLPVLVPRLGLRGAAYSFAGYAIVQALILGRSSSLGAPPKAAIAGPKEW